MICLSKNLADEYINKYAMGAKLPIHDYDYDHSGKDILIRSLAQRKVINKSVWLEIISPNC